MAYEITVGHAQLTINVGECVLTTETDGQIRQPSDRGLFYRDTRLLSGWTVEVNGRPWKLLSSAATSHYAAQVVLTNPALPTDDGELPQHSVSLTLSRTLGLGGLRETLVLRNHNRTAARLVLTAQLRCDFADIFDVKAGRIVSRGSTASRWSADEGRLETVHTNGRFRRGISVCPADGSPKPELRDGALGFIAELAPWGAWTAELLYQVIDGEQRLDASQASFAEQHNSEQARALAEWRSQAMRVRTPCAPLQHLYDQSLDDLAALRLPMEGTDATQFVPAAGIPWFAALFGRDSLITALQTVAVYPAFARGALEVLAQYQADDTDDSRDMQPGKIPHELRRGELSELGLGPYRPYYGTADATALYPLLLHEVWRLTGTRNCSKGTSKRRSVACSGSTNTATWTATASRSTSAGHPAAPTTRAGGIRATASRMRTAGMSPPRRRPASCRATFTRPGSAWPRSLKRSTSRSGRIASARRPAPSLTASTPCSGTRRSSSTPCAWTRRNGGS